MITKGDGIKWLLELDAKLDGAKAITKELGAAESAAHKTDEAFKKVEGHTFGGWKEVFKGELAFKAVEKGAELAYEAIKEVGKVIVEAFGLAAQAERTSKVFGNLLGKEGGAETLEDLEKFAELSEFTDDALEGMGNELLRAGLRGADFRNALGMALDVAAEAPNKVEGAQQAIASLSKIAMTGKVDNGSLRGLRMDPHEVERQLSQDLGLAPDVIKKKLEEGTLEGAKAMDSIFTVMERKTGKQLGGLGAEMADTFGARLEKVKDIPEGIFKSMKDSPGFKDMNDALGDILKNFGEGSPFGKAIRTGLSDVMTVVGKTIKDINWTEASGALKDIVDITRMWVPLLGKAVELVGKVLHPFAEAAREIADWGEHAGREAALSGGDENEKNFAAALAGGDGKILKAGGVAMVQAIDEGVKEEAEIHSPSKLFERHGEMMGEGLAVGMESSRARVGDAAGVMVQPPDLSGGDWSPSRSFHAGGVTVNLAVNVGGTNASAEDIAREVSLQAPSAILAALEQLGIQAGLA